MKYSMLRAAMIVALAAILLLCGAAMAEATIIADGNCGLTDLVQWKLDSDGVLTIYGSGAVRDYGLSAIAGGSAPWKPNYAEEITSVVVEEGVTRIGNYAFWQLDALEAVSIADTVSSIGDSTFYGCDAIVNISLPDSITTIGNSAFGLCKKLESITIPGSVTSMGDDAFIDCVNLTSAVISEGVTSISTNAFQGCWKLADVQLPSTLQVIGNSAFYNCRALTSVEIPSSVTTIENYAFSHCDALKSAVIPASVKTIGTGAFPQYSTFTASVFANSEGLNWCKTNYVNYVVADAAASGTCGSDLKWWLSSDGVLNIYGSGAMTDYNAGAAPWYSQYASITGVVIENGVTSIGNNAFNSCEAIKSVVIPESVVSIGDHAFEICVALESVSLPGNLTSIGSSAFYYCMGLTEIDIPVGVTSIGSRAFHNCLNLAKATIPYTVTSIGADAFNSCSPNLVIACHADSAAVEHAETNSIAAEIEEHDFTNGDCVCGAEKLDYTYTIENNQAVITGYTGSDVNVIIPSEIDGYPVTEIGSFAFNGNSIATLEIPGSVKTIGQASFTDCGIQGLTLNEGLETIGDDAFSYNNLISLEIPGSVKTIGDWAFADCGIESLALNEGLETIGENAFYGNNIAALEIPGSMKIIGNSAFYDCGIQGLVLNEGLEAIDDYAFYGNNIATLEIPGSVKTIGGDAFNNSGIQSLTLNEGLESIGFSAFAGNNIGSLVIPASVESIGDTALNNYISRETDYIFLNPSETADYGLEMIGAGPSVRIYCYKDSAVDSWAEENTRACSYLDAFVLPEDAVVVKSEAFAGLPMDTVSIPAGCETIESRAFADCANLSLVWVHGDDTVIAEGAFSGCENVAFLCAEGSAAAAFAEEYGFKWIAE